MKGTEAIVGSWAGLIGEEFFKPYMAEIQKEVNGYRSCVGFGVKLLPEGDYFEVFKKTPLDKVKVLYIMDDYQFNEFFMFEIEQELCNGLDLELILQTKYDHFLEQGIMFFPRHLTWTVNGGHTCWRNFTDVVICKLIAKKPILVITLKSDLITMLETLGHQDIISPVYCWGKADEWVKKTYNENISWSPLAE